MQTPNPSPSRRRGGRKNFKVLDGGEPGGWRELPHSLEAEERLLGGLLLGDAAEVGRCQRARLEPSHFYSPKHKAIYDTILALHTEGYPHDAACVAERMKSDGTLDAAGGYAMIGQVSATVSTTAQFGFFLDQVIEKAICRRIIRECGEAMEEAYDFKGELLGFTGGVAGRMTAIADYVMGRLRRVTQREAAGLAKQEALDVAHGRVDKSRWLHFPWPRVDAAFLAVDTRQEDWLNLVAAPPSGGKSSFLRALAAAWLCADEKGVIFLLETSRKRWIQSLAASLAGVNLRQLEETQALFPEKFKEFTAWMEVIEQWMEERLWVFDDVVALEDIARITRELNRTLREKEIAAGVPEEQARGLSFVVGDYLQIVTTRRQFLKRTEELAHITRTLKQLHRGLDVPGFWGAQITREARNEGRRPSLADLSESKALEENADRVEFLHVPTDEDGQAPSGEQATITMEVIQRKSRNGPKDVAVELLFNRLLSQFSDGSRKHPMAAPKSNPPPDGKIRKGDFQ